MNTELVTVAAELGKTVITSPAVQGVVSSLITTLFMRRGEKIKTLESLKKHEFEKVIDSLLDSGRMSYVEFHKCKNFLTIAERADEMMADYQESGQDSEDSERNKFSFDWLMRFFDAVGNISSEDLQQLWGKVLASEISRPKLCSLRTMDIIRNMSPEEAKSFSELCKYVMQSGDAFYIDSAGFFCEEDGRRECRDYIKKSGLSYEDHIIPLLEAGVLSTDHDLAIYINKENNLTVYNDKLAGVVMSYEEEPFLFQREAYFLTASGKEIFHVIHNGTDYEADEEYALLCLKEMKKQNTGFYVGAYSLSEDNMTDLLEEA